MSYGKLFVVAGGIKGKGYISAGLGSLVTKDLLAKGVKVKVIARAGSVNSEGSQELAKLGATILEVDYSDTASVEGAVDGADVVLSFLSGDGIGAPQINLAKASKSAGVKLFVPSEYGISTLGLDSSSPLWDKTSFHQILKDLDLPFVLISTGPFADLIKIFLGIKDGKVTITGSGDDPLSWTAREDIARFVAYITTTIPLSQLANKSLAIEGSRHSWNEVIAFYNKANSTTLEVTHETAEDALKRWKTAHDFRAWIQAHAVITKNGGLSDPSCEPAGNAIWKEWNPKNVSAFI